MIKVCVRYQNRVNTGRVEFERFLILILTPVTPLPDAAFEQYAVMLCFYQITGACYLLCCAVKA
jgi:hypothetical protein